MSTLFPLRRLDAFDHAALKRSIRAAPLVANLKDAVGLVIKGIHGLPEALDCELRQVEVYLGRTGSAPTLLRNRWKHRMGELGGVPSVHATALFRGHTAQLREERWESAAQRILHSLARHGGLCCSNAVVGNNGPWPSSHHTTIYLVARVRPGQAGELSERGLNAAIRELLESDLRDAVAREAARLIPNPEERIEHDIAASEEGLRCREVGCEAPSRPNNFGYCGRHRKGGGEVHLCKAGCGRVAREGNYHFCGYCRRTRETSSPPCKRTGCAYPAKEGNYGYCGVHRGRG